MTDRNEFSKQRIEHLNSLLQITMGTTADIAKWLYASLLATNLVALVATFAADLRMDYWFAGSIVSFIIGIFLAFLLGYSTWRRGDMAVSVLIYDIKSEVALAVGEHLEDNAIREANEIENRLKSTELFPHIVGWLSVASFVIGALLFATSMILSPAESPTLATTNDVAPISPQSSTSPPTTVYPAYD